MHSLCFLPHFQLFMSHSSMPASAGWGGSAACSWHPGVQADLGKCCAGASPLCRWLSLCHASLGWSSWHQNPSHDAYKHSSLRLSGDIEVPQLPLSAGAPGGTQHPKGMLNPSLNQALLAYFQAFTDAIFSTLIFNPPSLSKPIFPNLKFPDAF